MTSLGVLPLTSPAVAVAVDVSGEVSRETPVSPFLTQPRRSRRRPRAEFIRDVRRLITASWLAKTGQQWRWTLLDREYLYQLTMRSSPWEVMAAWDCYINRPWQACRITHFCCDSIQNEVRRDSRYRDLREMYQDRLECKRGMKLSDRRA
jgi:hypothetical protein